MIERTGASMRRATEIVSLDPGSTVGEYEFDPPASQVLVSNATSKAVKYRVNGDAPASATNYEAVAGEGRFFLGRPVWDRITRISIWVETGGTTDLVISGH